MMCKQSARKYPGPTGFLDFSLNEMREPGGGHWGFRFCGFGQFLIRFFGFRS